MHIFRQLESKTNRGPADWFTGEVWIQPLLTPEQSPSQRSAVVNFAAGARTAWHTHPRGQMLFIVSGVGAVQRDGGPVEHVQPGDVVWFAPNERHWHGATSARPMVHVAVQEADDNGEVVTWMEHVEG
jgi:quercetin dioxygenase-like cupin family protein